MLVNVKTFFPLKRFFVFPGDAATNKSSSSVKSCGSILRSSVQRTPIKEQEKKNEKVECKFPLSAPVLGSSVCLSIYLSRAKSDGRAVSTRQAFTNDTHETTHSARRGCGLGGERTGRARRSDHRLHGFLCWIYKHGNMQKLRVIRFSATTNTLLSLLLMTTKNRARIRVPSLRGPCLRIPSF